MDFSVHRPFEIRNEFLIHSMRIPPRILCLQIFQNIDVLDDCHATHLFSRLLYHIAANSSTILLSIFSIILYFMLISISIFTIICVLCWNQLINIRICFILTTFQVGNSVSCISCRCYPAQLDLAIFDSCSDNHCDYDFCWYRGGLQYEIQYFGWKRHARSGPKLLGLEKLLQVPSRFKSCPLHHGHLD